MQIYTSATETGLSSIIFFKTVISKGAGPSFCDFYILLIFFAYITHTAIYCYIYLAYVHAVVVVHVANNMHIIIKGGANSHNSTSTSNIMNSNYLYILSKENRASDRTVMPIQKSYLLIYVNIVNTTVCLDYLLFACPPNLFKANTITTAITKTSYNHNKYLFLTTYVDPTP